MFERLYIIQLYINITKYNFNINIVEFLGFIIRPIGIKMDSSQIEAIRDQPLLQSFYNIQIFLEFTNFYKRFIKGYLKIIYSLTNLLKGIVKRRKIKPFQLTSKVILAFKELCDYFIKAPLLRHFNPTLQILIKTNKL